MPKAIPEGWINCPSRATDLIEGLFFAFKTPLNGNTNNRLPAHHRFTVSMLLEEASLNFNAPIGLIVNLTNTNRYYDPEKELTKRGVEFEKILCEGQNAPNSEKTKQFIETCANWSSENPNILIGVHCTHGYNRTGFLLCAYLIEKMNYNVKEALDYFSRIRPPGIYRQNIVNELYNRYGDHMDVVPIITDVPIWKLQVEKKEKNSKNCEK